MRALSWAAVRELNEVNEVPRIQKSYFYFTPNIMRISCKFLNSFPVSGVLATKIFTTRWLATFRGVEGHHSMEAAALHGLP